MDRTLPPDEELPEWAFCIVGNVMDEHPVGEDKQIINGTKHFRPGARLFILDAFWGDAAENVIVMGQPRNRRNLIQIVIMRKSVHNFRVKQVYDKRVIRALYLSFSERELQTTEWKTELENRAEYWNSVADVAVASEEAGAAGATGA